MNNELYHYGVPGMRWGKRKSRLERRSAKLKSKAKAAYADKDLAEFGAKGYGDRQMRKARKIDAKISKIEGKRQRKRDKIDNKLKFQKQNTRELQREANALLKAGKTKRTMSDRFFGLDSKYETLAKAAVGSRGLEQDLIRKRRKYE